MLILVILLVGTNLATLGVLAYLYFVPDEGLGPDTTTAAALDRSPRPRTVPGGTRRMISIEILNPIELAGTRGRLAGLAGSLVPGLTRRIVYDQTLKIVKQQLVEQQVVADVRIHTLRPVPAAAPTAGRAALAPRPADGAREPSVVVDVPATTGPGDGTSRPADAAARETAAPAYTDEVEKVDLDDVGDPPG